ncbi:major facilitator superfamily domain-containing protein [Trichoderma compactum]
MYDTFQESALGQAIRFVSRNKWLQKKDQISCFHQNGEDLRRERTVGSIQRGPYMENGRFDPEQQIELKKTKSEPIVPHKTNDGIILVDWYTTDDPANPQNWSSFKRSYIVFVICLYTWASELGLALYVLAYGVGPLIFGPLTEIPVIGRNPVYYLTFLVFFALSFPAATINSFGGLLAVRFFAGFFGSVGIAIGGASIQNVFTLIYFPYGLGWWVLSFWAGPAIGPTFAGFAAMEKGWRWPLWEVVWICAVMAIFLLALTPETSAPNILLRRAKRLRKLTGDARLQSQSEIDQRAHDPSIFFDNLYAALTYAIYFTFFEVFPLVFPPFYGFNLGETDLAFLACEVGSILALILYFAYLHFYMIPDNIKNGFREASIHWIVPLFGVTMFVLGQYMVIQGLFMYVPVSYPQYAASIFTGNDLIRSTVATGCILAARPMFINLGVHKGVTVLAGLSIMGIIGTLLMYKYGKSLRAKSKFAQA